MVTVMCASAASAQDRLPPIPADKLTEAQKKAAAEFLVERKQEVFRAIRPAQPQSAADDQRPRRWERICVSATRCRATSASSPSCWCRGDSRSECEWCIHAADGKTAGLSDAIIRRSPTDDDPRG